MPLQPNAKAPYTSASAVITALGAYRDRGLGTPITAEVLARADVPETITRRTVQSLRLLELVDKQGQPTPTFEAFSQARGEEEYQALLQEWLRAVYADVLQYADPSKDVPDRMQEAFRSYEPAGQRIAMASLLVGLWRYAGLPIAAAENGGSRLTVTRTRPPRKRKSKPTGGITIKSATGDLPPSLVGLLHEIPKGGDSWTTERREAFLKAFEAMVDFLVRVDDTPPQVADDGEEGEYRS